MFGFRAVRPRGAERDDACAAKKNRYLAAIGSDRRSAAGVPSGADAVTAGPLRCRTLSGLPSRSTNPRILPYYQRFRFQVTVAARRGAAAMGDGGEHSVADSWQLDRSSGRVMRDRESGDTAPARRGLTVAAISAAGALR